MKKLTLPRLVTVCSGDGRITLVSKVKKEARKIKFRHSSLFSLQSVLAEKQTTEKQKRNLCYEKGNRKQRGNLQRSRL